MAKLNVRFVEHKRERGIDSFSIDCEVHIGSLEASSEQTVAQVEFTCQVERLIDRQVDPTWL